MTLFSTYEPAQDTCQAEIDILSRKASEPRSGPPVGGVRTEVRFRGQTRSYRFSICLASLRFSICLMVFETHVLVLIQ